MSVTSFHLFLISAILVLAKIRILTPEFYTTIDLEYETSSLGNPGFYPIIGKLAEIPLINCDLNFTLSSYTIALITNEYNCSYPYLLKKVEESGALGVIIVNKESSCTKEILSSITIDISIPIILIPYSTYMNFLYQRQNIILTYQNPLSQSQDLSISLSLIGSFQAREKFISSILSLYSSVPDLHLDKIFFGYTDNKIIFQDQDCIKTDIEAFCDSGDLPGSELLESSVVSQHIYHSLEDYSHKSIKNFLSYLQELYSTCKLSPIKPCHESIIQKYSFEYDSLDPFVALTNLSSNSSFFTLDSYDVLWPSYLFQAYCLISQNNSVECTDCADSCGNGEYYADSCVEACNKSECGFSNLKCLLASGFSDCYGIMIDDGVCSTSCGNEDDCSRKIRNSKFDQYLALLILICVLIPVSTLSCV